MTGIFLIKMTTLVTLGNPLRGRSTRRSIIMILLRKKIAFVLSIAF